MPRRRKCFRATERDSLVVRRREGMVFGLEEQWVMAWMNCKDLGGHLECRVK
jgi:hypothetical protein